MQTKKVTYFCAFVVGIALFSSACESEVESNKKSVPTVMPNLTALNYKDAKNALDGTLFEGKLTYEDLFEDRILIRDVNWIVVTQEPAPGTQFDKTDYVCVGVVKLKEETRLSDAKKLVCSAHKSLFETNEKENSTTTTSTVVPITTTTQLFSVDEVRAAFEQMREERDVVQDVTFYYDKSSPTRWATTLYPYIGTSPGATPWLRFVVGYSGSDWIFWSNVVLNVDGKIFKLDYNNFDVKRDNNGNGVHEWADVLSSERDLLLMVLIANSKTTVIRLQGDTFREDFELSATQKRAISNVVKVYAGLVGNQLFISDFG